MAQWHLDELRSALERSGWRFVEELPGDDRAISASWAFVRSGEPPNDVLIDFEGLDDLHVLPLLESYGCRTRNHVHSLYFGRRGEGGSSARERWKEELGTFVTAIGKEHAV